MSDSPLEEWSAGLGRSERLERIETALSHVQQDVDDLAASLHRALNRIQDLEGRLQQLEAHLLEGVLLDDSASPLRHALETSDLGSAPSPLCGLEASNREMSFMCGLEGSKPGNTAALEMLVLEVLQKVADEGIPAERVEAVLHQLELSQREVAGDGYPYGLQLILEGLPSAIHRGDPVARTDRGGDGAGHPRVHRQP